MGATTRMQENMPQLVARQGEPPHRRQTPVPEDQPPAADFLARTQPRAGPASAARKRAAAPSASRVSKDVAPAEEDEDEEIGRSLGSAIQAVPVARTALAQHQTKKRRGPGLGADSEDDEEDYDERGTVSPGAKGAASGERTRALM